jgi:pyruvate, orthophosphate dikinase
VELLLQVLCVKGRASHEALGAAIDADVTNAIAALEQAGLVEPTKLGYRITELGKRRADELYELERSEARSLILDVYDSFLPINDEVKQIVTDWQMRIVSGEMVLNDHTDPDHDRAVIDRLHDTDAKVSIALDPLRATLPRFDLYAVRLQRALTCVRDGDHSMICAPIKDSYHTVWFELHEELIILSGRSRSEEAAG